MKITSGAVWRSTYSVASGDFTGWKSQTLRTTSASGRTAFTAS